MNKTTLDAPYLKVTTDEYYALGDGEPRGGRLIGISVHVRAKRGWKITLPHPQEGERQSIALLIKKEQGTVSDPNTVEALVGLCDKIGKKTF